MMAHTSTLEVASVSKVVPRKATTLVILEVTRKGYQGRFLPRSWTPQPGGGRQGRKWVNLVAATLEASP
jgi:hypothetical protein